MNEKNEVKQPEKPIEARPGEGIRSMRSTYAFRLINYELYAKPSEIFIYFSHLKYLFIMIFLDIVIMTIGVVSIISVFGYIGYMNYKFEGLGYYKAVKDDGTEVFEKKKSRWER